MPESLGLQIAKEIQSRLGASSVEVSGQTFNAPTDLTVSRGRVSKVVPRDVAEGKTVMDVSYAGDPQPTSPVGGRHSTMVERQAKIFIAGFANGNDEPAEDVVDPLRLWAVRVLMADPTLGHLIDDIVEYPSEIAETVFAESEEVIAAVEIEFRANYHSRRDDPARRN